MRELPPERPEIVLFVVVIAAFAVTDLGQVREVHDGTAFIDRGARHGVVVGATLPVQRAGVVVGDCLVVDVSDSRAACRGAAVVADRVVVGEAIAPAPPRRRTTPPTSSTLQHLRTDVDAHRPVLVAHPQRARAQPVWRDGARDGGHVTFNTSGVVSSALPGAAGFAASVDVAARYGLRSITGIAGSFVRGAVRVASDLVPSSPDRFRPGAVVEPYVFEALVGIEDADQPLRLYVGRFHSPQAVGLPLLDGVQAGVAVARDLELGVFGGTLPDLVTIAPTTRPTAGVYGTARFSILDGVQLVPRARVGVVADVASGRSRADSEADLQLIGGAGFFVSAGARVSSSSAGTTGPGVALTRANVDADISVLPWLQLSGGVRHVNGPGFDPDVVDTVLNDLVTSIPAATHADLAVRLPLSRWLAFSVQGAVVDHDLGGGSDDGDVVDTHVRRYFTTATVDVPRVFTDVVGASLGWQEEIAGTAAGVSGRLVFTQLLLRPRREATVVVRATASQLQVIDGLDEPLRDLGLSTFVDVEVLPYLFLRSHAQGLQTLRLEAQPAHGSPATLRFDVAVTHCF